MASDELSISRRAVLGTVATGATAFSGCSSTSGSAVVASLSTSEVIVGFEREDKCPLEAQGLDTKIGILAAFQLVEDATVNQEVDSVRVISSGRALATDHLMTGEFKTAYMCVPEGENRILALPENGDVVSEANFTVSVDENGG